MGQYLMEKTACFIGHRKIEDTQELRERLTTVLTALIEKDGVEYFLFGDKSAFDDFCYETVTRLKEQYPQIQRIRYRRDHPMLDEYSKRFYLKGYEDSICPEGVEKAGRASYIKRNQAMIDDSGICVFYYKEEYLPEKRKNSKDAVNSYQPKSGTQLAFAYAVKQGKRIINMVDLGGIS